MKSLLTWKALFLTSFMFLSLSISNIQAQRTHIPMTAESVGIDSKMECTNTMKTKMVNSAFPVQLQLKGNRLCVTSKYIQVLPVYNEKGLFYGVFRLNKGTNWINGLPKGTYFVNSRKIMIP